MEIFTMNNEYKGLYTKTTYKKKYQKNIVNTIDYSLE